MNTKDNLIHHSTFIPTGRNSDRRPKTTTFSKEEPDHDHARSSPTNKMSEVRERERRDKVDPQHHRGLDRQTTRSPHSEDFRQKMRSVQGRVPDFSEMRDGYDNRMGRTQRRNEGVLRWRLGQPHWVGSDDSHGNDKYWRYMRTPDALSSDQG